MNSNDDGVVAAGGDGLDEADTLWLDAALHEAVAAEAAPDLRSRIAAASPAQAAAAAACVDAARATPARRHWWAAAVLLFGSSVVGGVFALQRSRTEGAAVPLAASQEPARELEVADAKQLAAHLARSTTVALTAVQGPEGTRLPNEPEHGALVHDASWLPALRAALGAEIAIGEPLAQRETQAELRLCSEVGFVRLRVAIVGDTVRVGAARFACTAPLPAGLAAKVRDEWLVLAAQKPPARQRLQVHTQRQLIAAIGSDRTIELIGGPFVLTGSDDEGELPANPAVEFRDPDPVPFLVLKGVHNLRLCSIGGPVHVLGKSPADVLRCEDCRDVTFEGLVLGHDTGVAHYCSAPVLVLQRCSRIVVRDCELFGCGTEGVVAEQVDGFRMERGEIHTCRNGVVTFSASKAIGFHGTVFRDCALWQPGFNLLRCEAVRFTDCTVRGLDGSVDRSPEGQLVFFVSMDEAVQFVRGTIHGNRVQRVANSKLLLVREGTDERDNGPDVVLAPVDGQDGRR